MKPDQIHVLAAAMFGNSKQVFHALEPGLSSQIVGDVRDRDGIDRIHDDVAIVHSVAAADFDVRPRPDANAASDSFAADALAKGFHEHHAPLLTGERLVDVHPRVIAGSEGDGDTAIRELRFEFVRLRQFSVGDLEHGALYSTVSAARRYHVRVVCAPNRADYRGILDLHRIGLKSWQRVGPALERPAKRRELHILVLQRAIRK